MRLPFGVSLGFGSFVEHFGVGGLCLNVSFLPLLPFVGRVLEEGTLCTHFQEVGVGD